MKDVKRSFQSLKNNAQGHFFEQQIERACNHYREKGIANIHKTPEPFRVIKKLPAGRFQGQFIKKAEPDFKGVRKDGQAIVFECKFTTKDKISKSVLSKNQEVELERNYNLGAETFICVCFAEGVTERYFFIPFKLWLNMERHFGKKSIKASDLKMFEIYYNHSIGISFLENILNDEIAYARIMNKKIEI